MSVEEAVAADRLGDVTLASALYEEAIDEGDRSLEILLNLAIL